MRLDIGTNLFELNSVKELSCIPLLDLSQASIPSFRQREHRHALAAYIGFDNEVVTGSLAVEAEAIPAARIKG